MEKRRFLVLAGVVTGLGLFGCATTSVKSVWKDPQWNTPMGSIMVVAAAEKIGIRRVVEDEVASQLQAKGVMASASYAYGHPVQVQALEEKVKQANFDGVLVLQMVDQKTIVTTTPEETRISTYNDDPYRGRPGYGASTGGGYHSGWSGYYDQSMTITRTPSQTQEHKIVSLETKLFSAKGNSQPVWSALSETYVPAETGGQAKPLARAIVQSLSTSKVIP